MSEEMVTLCFVAPAAMKLELEAWARDEDRSVSSLLRLLLDPPLDARRRGLEQRERSAQLAVDERPPTSVAGAAKVFEE